MNLVGVPTLLPLESPASWLTRTALSQGATMKELYRYFGLEAGADPDVAFSAATVKRVAALTGQPVDSFAFIRHMLIGLRKVDTTGTEYLLADRGRARYRFCGACLAIPGLKSFPLHWRFKAWRWCPEHTCMLLDRCPHCLSNVYLPGEMLTAGKCREGVAQLDHCLICAQRLSIHWQVDCDTLDFSITAPWEETLLNNGRAVLAALLHRHFRVEEHQEQFSLRGLRRIQKQGLLPHDHFQLEHTEMLRRRLKRTTLQTQSTDR